MRNARLSFAERIRNAGFNALDYMKGRPVMKHLDEIAYLWDAPSQIEAHQKRQFEKLAMFAIEHTEYYKGLGVQKTPQLSDFPIIDKTILKEHRDELCTYLAQEKGTVEMHTSGSTGTPLIVMQDKNKRNRVYAEMMYTWGLSGYQIGMKYAFLRRWNKINRKSWLTAYARNLVMVDVATLDAAMLEQIKNTLLKKGGVRMMIGYASNLNVLADYLLGNGCTPDMFCLETILSGSEVLTAATREKLKKVFGCNVVSLYSNQENGMLAVECNENKEFHLNEASYIFELLKLESDEPAEEGELGRVVITDLYNYAMPIIRYDTGDLAVRKSQAECEIHTAVIAAVEGRRVDIIYDVNGVPLSPHTVTNALWQFNKLKQFQLIQAGKRTYVFKINDPIMAYSDEELIQTCKEFFGESAEISIARVHDIPVLASGKFKYLICEL